MATSDTTPKTENGERTLLYFEIGNTDPPTFIAARHDAKRKCQELKAPRHAKTPVVFENHCICCRFTGRQCCVCDLDPSEGYMDPEELYRFFLGRGVSTKDCLDGKGVFCVQARYPFDVDGHVCFPFYPFRDERGLFGFFSHWSRGQCLGKGGVFAMECVRPGVAHKWVLDLDGKIKTLHEHGLCEGSTSATAAEVARVELLSLRYATTILMVLSRIGFISCEHVYFCVTRRHRYLSANSDLFGKLSLHITLGVSARHEDWLEAMRYVSWYLKNGGERRFLNLERSGLAIQALDDDAIKGNSAGQNISMLHANKASSGGDGGSSGAPEPIFEFAGLFLASVKDMRHWDRGEDSFERLDLRCLSHTCRQYSFSSMVLIDEMCVEGARSKWVAWRRSIEAKRELAELRCAKKGKKGQKGSGVNGSGGSGVDLTLLGNDGVEIGKIVPVFAHRVLFGDRTRVRWNLKSFGSMLPNGVTKECIDTGKAKCFYLEKPACCPRWLFEVKAPAVHVHSSNNCRVCVVQMEDTSSDASAVDNGNGNGKGKGRKRKGPSYVTRVFADCYCMMGKPRGSTPLVRDEVCAGGNWVELRECDLAGKELSEVAGYGKRLIANAALDRELELEAEMNADLVGGV